MSFQFELCYWTDDFTYGQISSRLSEISLIRNCDERNCECLVLEKQLLSLFGNLADTHESNF